MAGRISDRQEHGLLFHARLLQGFIAPRVPAYGVMGVLKKIGRGFIS
jgi:hypothetical protein